MNRETRLAAKAAHKRLQNAFTAIQWRTIGTRDERFPRPADIQAECNRLLRDIGWHNVTAFGFRTHGGIVGVLFIDLWNLRVLPLADAYRGWWIQAWTVRGTPEMRAQRAALLRHFA